MPNQYKLQGDLKDYSQHSLCPADQGRLYCTFPNRKSVFVLKIKFLVSTEA